MAYPLAGSSYTKAVEIINGDGGITPSIGTNLLTLDLTVTRTSHFTSMMFSTSITRAVEILPGTAITNLAENAAHGAVTLVLERAVTREHFFSGIGGPRYIPSFPQWDRRETSYPFAF